MVWKPEECKVSCFGEYESGHRECDGAPGYASCEHRADCQVATINRSQGIRSHGGSISGMMTPPSRFTPPTPVPHYSSRYAADEVRNPYHSGSGTSYESALSRSVDPNSECPIGDLMGNSISRALSTAGEEVEEHFAARRDELNEEAPLSRKVKEAVVSALGGEARWFFRTYRMRPRKRRRGE